MPDISAINLIILMPFIFLAGFIDSVAGGGGLISLPAYFSVGIPPHLALGTNKFSSCSGTIFSTARFYRGGLIDLPLALMSAVWALFGSWLGARTAIMVSAVFLNYLLILLIPIITLFSLLNRNIGYHDSADELKSSYKLFLGAAAGGGVGFYDGFFGPGTGSFLVLIFTALLHYDFKRANANAKVVNLASNIAALITFATLGQVYYKVAIPAAAFGIAGNLLGSKMVMLRGNKLIKQVFIFALLLLLGRVIWNLFA